MAQGNGLSLIALRFPVAGVVKRYGYQSQPPYTTPDCSNVRPFEVLKGRERGGSRPGISKRFAAAMGSPSPIQLLATVSWLNASDVVTVTLVGNAGGVFYRINADNWQAVTPTPAGLDLTATPKFLMSAQRGQKLYIADWGPTKVTGTTGVISLTTHLDDAAVGDWTTKGIDTDNDVCYIVPNSGTTPEQRTVGITAVAADYITLDRVFTNGSCSYEIARGMKVYDPSANTLTAHTTSNGPPPVRCPLICTYRDRLVLALGHLAYMSRQGDPDDWNYTVDPDDPGAAIYGGAVEGGELPEPIVAMIPHSDDYLIFGCLNSVWVLRGDWGFGGQMDALSRKVGFASATAWCQLPDSSILFLSRGGLYLIPPGAQGEPVPFSSELLPADLLDVDTVSNTVTMAYDVAARGIHLYVTPNDGTAGTNHWWIDWTTKTFWRVTLVAGQQPYRLVSYALTGQYPRYVLLGGYDGYVRRYDSSVATDDGETLTSWVKIGPFALGQPGTDGIISEIEGTLGVGSADVTWELRGGDSAEAAAVATSVLATGIWVAGRNARYHPRIRRVAGILYLTSTGSWAFENAVLGRIPGGRIR